MDTKNYGYDGRTYQPTPTISDSNSFFHAAFGVRTAEGDAYLDKEATSRRKTWAEFLAYFENKTMPSLLADVVNKCLTGNNKYEHASVEDQDCLKDYISDITKGERGLTVEDIPILAALENINIVLLVNGRSDPLFIYPDRGILGSCPVHNNFKGEVVLCLEENVFSRLNLIGLMKYKKGGTAGSEGVQFQVGLLTVFFLNALRKLSNWRLSTENTSAGKFDDVVLEWPEGATLLQAKHKKKKTKKITFDELVSPNSKNDDFSLPKYFLSFEEIKKRFPLKHLILCTNASVSEEVMKFVKPQDLPFESMLHWKDQKFKYYTFSDNILPHLKANAMTYHEKNSRNMNVDKSTISDENIKDFLRLLQFYPDYPPENDMRNVIEHLLSQLKSLECPYADMSSSEIHTKIMDWFLQEDGEYLTAFSAKAIFSEICRDRIWQKLERYNVFFRENMIFQTPQRIFHVIAKGSFDLLQELRIFRALQKDNNDILYAKADEDVVAHTHVIDIFQLRKYITLVIVWPDTVKESVEEEICLKLGNILSKFTYKKLIFLGNTPPLLLSPCLIGIIEKPSFDDLAQESQEVLLEKKCVSFQGRDVNLKELLATQATEDCRMFLDSEVLEKLIRGEKVKVGEAPSYLNKDARRCYVSRKFKKATAFEFSIEPELTFSEEDICKTDETVILISDGAGAGKSTVLTSLATKIKKMNPQLWVLRIDLNDYTNTLKEYLEANKETILIKELLNSEDSTRLTSYLEESVFLMNGKVVLMLDGFDEISPNITGLVISLLSACQGQRNFAKLIVTTRPQLSKKLENALQVTSLKLEPFTPQNEEDFLTSYWMENLDLSNTMKPKCKQYAKALMRRMSFWIKSDQEMSSSFTAIPLHFRLMAEIFQERDRLEGWSDWEGCKEFLTANRLEPKLPVNMNVARLYKMFVEKKHRVFVGKGNPSGNTAVNQALMNQLEECLDCHRSLALELILEEEQCRLFSCYRQTPESLTTSILEIGIVQKLSPFPQFVHRTFAEYFVAESFLLELKCSNRDAEFQKLLIEDILVKLSFDDIRTFVDGILHYMGDELPSTIFREYREGSCSFDTDMDLFSLLHGLARGGYVAILKLILNCMDSNCRGSNCVDSQMRTTLISYLEHDVPESRRLRIHSNVLDGMHVFTHLYGLNFIMRCEDETLLECASVNGRLQMAKFLVNRGADINAGEGKPIRLAALHGHLEIVKFLVEQGAEFKTKSLVDSPPYMAIKNNHMDIAEYFLEKMLEGAGSQTKDPLMAYTAAYLGRADVLEDQLTRALDVNSRVGNEDTLLFGAARGVQLEIIRYLVRQGCDINAKDSGGNTALMMPIRASTTEVLVTEGIDVNAVNSTGETALHIAARRGDFERVGVLVGNGADVNLSDHRGCTSLHAAMHRTGTVELPVVRRTRLALMKFLLESGADANINHPGDTLLHATAARGEFDELALLVEFDSDVNVRNKEGRTALHLAVLRNRIEIAKFLLQHGTATDIGDNSGQTVVHYIASPTDNLYSLEDRLDVLRLVLKSEGIVNIRDNKGCTALHLATRTDFCDAVVLLVKSGADMNVRDVKGNTVLHLAGCPKTVEYLASSGADVTAWNNSGPTALHLADKKDRPKDRESDEQDEKESGKANEKDCVISGTPIPVFDIKDATGLTDLQFAAKSGNRHVIRFLVEKRNANVHVKDCSGRTPLHLAAKGGHLDVVKLLLGFAADFKAKDNEGRTAAQLATAKRYLNVARMLEAHEELGDCSAACSALRFG